MNQDSTPLEELTAATVFAAHKARLAATALAQLCVRDAYTFRQVPPEDFLELILTEEFEIEDLQRAVARHLNIYLQEGGCAKMYNRLREFNHSQSMYLIASFNSVGRLDGMQL